MNWHIILDEPDQETLGVYFRQAQNVTAQAARYGEQVRLLEDRGLEEDRKKIRAAWKTFRAQLNSSWLGLEAHRAYYDAYCETGFQRKLPCLTPH